MVRYAIMSTSHDSRDADLSVGDGGRRYGSVRAAAIAFGVVYLGGGVLLSELVGSSADSTDTFSEHFASAGWRTADIVGGAGLAVAALLMVGLGLTLQARLARGRRELRSDSVAALALLQGSVLFTAAGLLATPSILRAIGALYSDPALEPAAAAGIAQAGIVVLLFVIVAMGLWTALVAWLSLRAGAIPRWLAVAGWVVAVLSLLGVTGVAAMLLGVWWLAFGFRWRNPA